MPLRIKNKNGEWIADQKAIQTSIMDVEGNFTSKNVEGALRELAEKEKARSNPELELQVQKNTIDIGSIKLTLNDHEERITYLEENGGGTNSVVTLTSNTESEIKTTVGKSVLLKYSYNSSSNRSGMAIYKVNNVVVANRKVDIGDVEFDISSYLKKGTNEVLIEVTDVNGGYDFLTFTIDVIELTIKSTFDCSKIFDGQIEFSYTATGNVEKTVHFIVDGKEIGTEIVRTSGTQRVYSIPKQNHGSHSLKVFATADLNGDNFESNMLYYNIVCIEDGAETPIVAIQMEETDLTVDQYSLINIPYLVYTPNSLESNITLSINDVVKGELIVSRELQYWRTTDFPCGEVVFKISCGEVSKSITVNVNEVDISIEEETTGMELHLSSKGRSNNASDKDIWSYGDVTAVMNNFNWKTNGFMADSDGITALRICDGAEVYIPFNIFSKDFKNLGKTIEIEFKVTDIINYETSVITCMSGGRGISITSKEAIFKSNEMELGTKFKEDEHIRLSFVVEGAGQHNIVYTYLNGIISGLRQYSASDIFGQQAPVGITLGSTDCKLEVYNIRIYDRALSTNGVLNNYIFDMDNPEEKLSLYNRNRILDEYGEILYSRVLDQVPCMIVTGELPPVKGNKKIVSVQYEDKENPDRSFNKSNVSMDIQGTSSQYYPKKNYKFKFGKDDKYSLREGMIPERVFTIKADYMESSHSHNTGMAKFVHNIYDEPVPPQVDDSRIRTTIDGFPIAMFHKETEDSTPKYFGVYNFNLDKDCVDTFGYTGNAESWEICNNTSARCLFKKSEYEAIDETSGDPEWLLDFEARFPEDFTDYTNLKRLTDWLVSTDGNPSKFKEEAEQYLNIHYTLTYYILTEFFGMVDSRAKNMFLSTWDGNIWYPVFYDMDTMIGLNNEGVNEFAYNIETDDVNGTQNVFNGKDSVLWQNVKEAFSAEIIELYNEMRNNGKLTYDKVMKIFEEEQIAKICESQFNADAQFKYLDPLINDKISTYLYIAQGSRINHIKYWIFNRFNYMDSKYVASDFKQKYATLRLYTPTNWSGVKPNANFNITPFADQYLGIKFGSYERFVRAKANLVTTVSAPDITFNDTETIIYGADRLLSLGDLSSKYAGTVDVSGATQLSELILGSSVTGYKNTNLHSVSVGSNKLMRKIDITNCPNVSDVLDLSGCPSIEEVHAKGTSIKTVNLSNEGANLKILNLPSSIVTLDLINKTNLDVLTMEGYNSLNMLKIENNSDNINPFSIVNNAQNLQYVRLYNVKGKTTTTIINKIKSLKGVDKDGLTIDISQAVSGSITIAMCSQELLEEYQEAFPYVEFTVENFAQTFTVDFIDGDGNIIYTDRVIQGGTAVYGLDTIPTKTSNVRYDYTFSGWDRPLFPITSNTTITALFTSTTRQYRIRFLNNDTGEVLSDSMVDYNVMPTQPAFPTGYNAWDSWVVSAKEDKDYACIAILVPSDTSMFTFGSMSLNGVSGYYCTLKSGQTLGSNLIFPFKYNNKPVLEISGTSSNSYPNITSVFIPPYVQKFGEYALKGLSNITEVDCKNITTIGTDCFNGCSKLTTINLPKLDMTNIPSFCFRQCTSLTELELGNIEKITTLNGTAFRGCASLTELEFPNVSSLGTRSNSSYVFYGCTNLTSIKLPNLTTIYGTHNFCSCTSLTDVEIPLVTELSESNFASCSSLETINLPNVTTFTGAGVFRNCTSLKNVNMPLFTGFSTVPTQYSNTENGWFANTGFENITDDTFGVVKYIPYECFKDCAKLKTVRLNNVAKVSFQSFANCSNLTSIEMNSLEDTSVLYSGSSSNENIFANCTSLIDVKLPNLKTFGSGGTFRGCTSLETIDLPNLTSIGGTGSQLFYGCTSLKNVNLPNLTGRIYYSMFYGCTSLQTLTFPKVTGVGGNLAFAECSNLEYVFMGSPESPVDYMHTTSSTISRIFYNCPKIQYVALCTANGLESDIEIPNYATTISNSGLGIVSSKIIYLTDGCQGIEETEDKEKYLLLEDGVCLLSIPNKDITTYTAKDYVNGKLVTGFFDSVFSYASKLQEVVAPNVKSIGNRCFYYCSALTTVDMPNVETTGKYCFGYCSALTTVDMPNVETTGQYCFYYCTALTTVNMPNVETVATGCFYHCNLSEIVDMPKLREIGEDSFRYCNKITSVTSNALERIGKNAFGSCVSLTSINLDNVIYLGAGALNTCTGLTYISAPLLTAITYGVFRGCTNLERVDLPLVDRYDSNGYSDSTGEHCFSSCTALKIVNMPKITELPRRCFYKCERLTSITQDMFPSLTKLGVESFENCSNLKIVDLPKVTTIGDKSFSNCTNLRIARFGSASSPVTSIGTDIVNTLTAMLFITESGTDEGVSITEESTTTYRTTWTFTDIDYELKVDTDGDIYFKTADHILFGKKCSTETTWSKEIIENLPITKLCGASFYNCTEIKTLTLPPTVKELPPYSAYLLGYNVLDFPYITKYKKYGFSSKVNNFTATLGSVGNPVTELADTITRSRCTELNIYTADGTGDSFTNAPFGAVNATISYLQA